MSKKYTYNTDFYKSLQHLLNQFKNKAEVARSLGMSRQALNYHIRRLNSSVVDEIEMKKSVKKIPQVTQSPLKKVRGHGFQIKLKIPTIKNWPRRTEYMRKQNIEYKDLGRYQRVFIGKYKVWLCAKSIIYYLDKTSFFGRHAQESYEGMYSFMIQLIRRTESLFKTSFAKGKYYDLKPSRNHYALVKNALAKEYNDQGKELMVYGTDGVLRLLIDRSYNIDELETVHPTTAKTDNIRVQRFFNRLQDGDIDAYEARVERVLKRLMEVTELNSRFIEKLQRR